jgi:hypothetical protein
MHCTVQCGISMYCIILARLFSFCIVLNDALIRYTEATFF